jgi:pSer/pThr/pTyr-binding forkhead associated (FHA) protein
MQVELHVISGEPKGARLVFGRGQYIFGRSLRCHFRLSCHSVSHVHCLLRVADAVVTVRDLGSRNSTVVNGERTRTEVRLRDADRLLIGSTTFQVIIQTTNPCNSEDGVSVTGIPLEETFMLPAGGTRHQAY